MTARVTTFGPGTIIAHAITVRDLMPFIASLLAAAAVAQQPPPRFFEPYKGEARQATDTPTTRSAEAGRITVHADPRIEQLMERFSATKHPQAGYRVQIYLGTDRKAAEELKRAYLLKNPDTPAYLSWLAPNWRLRVGDLRTRLEAERLLRDLKPVYAGSYIVPDEIEMPR